MRSVIIAAIVLLLGSCRTPKPIIDSVKENSSTRLITYKETIRDTAIVVRSDSSAITALLACDSAGNILIKQLLRYQQGTHIQPPQLDIKNNVLIAKTRVDSFSIYLMFKERLKTDSIANSNNDTITVTVKENYLTGWQWFQIWCGRILLCLTIIFIGAGVVKSKL